MEGENACRTMTLNHEQTEGTVRIPDVDQDNTLSHGVNERLAGALFLLAFVFYGEFIFVPKAACAIS